MATSKDLLKTWVVIPNLNNEDLLRACLRSLLQQVAGERVIVVDNGSVDTSIATIKNISKNIVILKNKINKGFVGGVNPGIMHAIEHGAEYVALLNNDAVVEKEWLQKLVEAMERNEKNGIVASKMMHEDKKYLDSTGEQLTIWGAPFPRGRNEVDVGQYDDKTEVFGASGGASLYRVDMLKEIGLFDDDYFAYLEDVDLSFRARAAGWKVVYEPGAVVYHGLSKTSSMLGKDFAFYHFVKNFMLLYVRNMPLKLYAKYLPLFSVHLCRLFLSSIKHKRPHVFFKGVFAAFKLHSNTIRARGRNKQLRKLSSNEIDNLLLKQLPPRPPRIEDGIRKME